MIPSPSEVRQIFNETYNVFYKKWINPNTPYDPGLMLQEAHELNQKYDCELCRHMVADLIECIEDEQRRRD
jgi:hypothetical protein